MLDSQMCKDAQLEKEEQLRKELEGDHDGPGGTDIREYLLKQA